MEVVPASGTILLSDEAFSMINLYERVTDRWATGLLEWHAEGLVLNHVPLIRRLKLREVIGVRSIAGDGMKNTNLYWNYRKTRPV